MRIKRNIAISIFTLLCISTAAATFYISYGIEMYVIDIEFYKYTESTAAKIGWTDELISEAESEIRGIEEMATKNVAYKMAYEARHDVLASASKYVVLAIASIIFGYACVFIYSGLYILTVVSMEEVREERLDAQIKEAVRKDLRQERASRLEREERKQYEECLKVIEELETKEEFGWEWIDLDGEMATE